MGDIEQRSGHHTVARQKNIQKNCSFMTKKTGQIIIKINDEFVDVQKAKLLKQKKEEGNTAFKNSQLEEAYKLYR